MLRPSSNCGVDQVVTNITFVFKGFHFMDLGLGLGFALETRACHFAKSCLTKEELS